MKTTTKKSLCVLNAILSAIAYLLLHATIWFVRGSNMDAKVIYLDENVVFLILGIIALFFAFGGVFCNPKNDKKKYIVSAVVNAIPAIALPATLITILLAYHGIFNSDTLMQTWRLIPAVILYLAVSAIYFAVAFTKTKEVENNDATIPYSD